MTVADSASPPRSPTPAAPRVALLAFPSPTTIRFVVILAAMLAAGLFIGDWAHSFLHREQYVRAIENCYAQADYASSIDTAREEIAINDAASECYAGAQHLRAAYALGGAALVILLGAAVLFLAPPIIEWRRRLQPVVAKLPATAGRVDELAHYAGLRYPPTVMLGGAKQRDAFSYGWPRRHKIALPPAVAVKWNHRNLFDPLALHELAHLRNRDVGFSWLTRGAMYAVVPLLTLPVIAGIISNDFSLVRDYAWRAAILMATVWIIAIALLRSREHDADLRAATVMDEPDTMIALVSSVRAPAPSRWRRLTAYHPTPAARADILTRPDRAAEVKFLDGLVPAYLAASAMPLIEGIATAVSTGRSFASHQTLVAPGICGVLLGCTVGLGLWRAVIVDRAMGIRPTPWIAAAGVAAGLALGQLASLGNTTTGLRGGLGQPLWLMIHVVAGLAATALVYSLAEVSADAVWRLRSPRWAWMPGVVIASLVYGAALHLSDSLQLTLDVGHWVITRHFLVGQVDTPYVLLAMAAAAVFTAAAVVFKRGSTMAPAWLFDRSVVLSWPTAGVTIARPLIVGLVCGICAIIPYGVYRNSAPNELDEARVVSLVEVTTWSGATAATAAALALIVCVPRRGLALATIAGPVAIGTFMVGFVTVNAVEANVPNIVSVLAPLTSDIVGLSFTLVTLVAPLALIPRILDCGVAWTAAAAALSAITMCSIAVVVTANASPYNESEIVVGDLRPQTPESMMATQYLQGPGKQTREGVILAYAELQTILQFMNEEPSAASLHVRSNAIEPLTALKTELETVRFRSPTIEAVHADGIALIDSFIVGFGQVADGLAAGDEVAVLLAMTEMAESDQSDRWDSGVHKLIEIAGSK